MFFSLNRGIRNICKIYDKNALIKYVSGLDELGVHALTAHTIPASEMLPHCHRKTKVWMFFGAQGRLFVRVWVSPGSAVSWPCSDMPGHKHSLQVLVNGKASQWQSEQSAPGARQSSSDTAVSSVPKPTNAEGTVQLSEF